MAIKPTALAQLLDHGFDTVIDVRSPAEFAEDHLPGAINLPVLDNEERARVGTMYKQQSPFLARKIGAALVFRNAADHIAGPLADREGGWRPLVYCWRGGQRSGSFAWMLKEIGWRSELIDGGYRTYRRLVSQALYDVPLPHRLVQLGGYTGTAKTELLPLLAARGVQVVDLEGLARHRGSLLGEMPGGQPSQKGFETALAQVLHRLDPTRPVVVEAESSKIGTLTLPPSLWEAMKIAPWVEIAAPIAARAQYLARAYEDILADHDGLRAKLAHLRFHRGHALVDHWETLIAADDRLALCESLAVDHYDPAYNKSMRAMSPNVLYRIEAPALDPAALNGVADQLAERLHATSI
ncbi:tRNA 2-selenouridine(34) synthase MnmH [Tropicibacter naphthalenivorans]|uniref:tRNA 2-selenouridine synthase n=1 Tax=Tropicibacter naphthalenivorans TaxID=441103 RepID=A0A0N7M167_9RHOB|nr:tRNA 2-selenouridine(34) synthase MnmH [Tropicibacter naphthalenivorans]CUH82417.1 tRNA 2-selenouridine synthase [Tropicibacter naphthalenivorans]SMD06339.1 tRNA 2-selenouridine synthase [Tropicibacter naphthalenivorans]